ncbi:MAG: BACON domain-containing carbohydrate-binding protein [Vicinamibacterales bacterium]
MTVAGQSFTVTQAGVPCTYALSSSAATAAPGGGNDFVTMTSPLGCAWTVTSSAPWLTLRSGSSGSGVDIVGYTAAANTTSSPRVGTLTIGGQTLTVSQDSASCAFTVVPAVLPMAAQVAVTGASSFTWVASTAEAVALQRAGSVDRLKAAWYGMNFSIDVNMVSGRSQQIAIYVADYDNGGRAEKFDVVDQSGVLLDTRTVSNFGAGKYLVWSVRGHVTVNVTPVAGSNAVVSAILIGAGSAAGGATAANFINTDSATQGSWKGVYGEDGYTIAADASSQVLAGSGGAGAMAVTTPSDCPWTATSDAAWLTMTSGASGTGPGSAAFAVAANTTGAARTGILTVAGRSFSMTQAAPAQPACQVTIATTAKSVAAAGESGSVAVTAAGSCAWTASSDAAWLTVTSGSTATGNGTVSFTAALNPTASIRTANLNIGGQIVTVTQAAGTAVDCTLTLSTSSQVAGAAGGTGSVAVGVANGCAWAASSNAAWLTVTSGASGSGTGTMAFSVAANASTSSRLATITVGTQTFSLTQTGSSCNVVIAPGGLPVPASLAVTGADSWTWMSGTSDPRAMERATADRVMAAWYGDIFAIDVNVAAGRAQQVAVYAADYDSAGRQQRYEVLNPSGTVLDSRTISDYVSGRYVVWTVTGHVTIRVTRLAGRNAVVSGLFLSQAAAGTATSGTTATFLKTDDTTAGNWKGVYGGNGYSIAADASAQYLDPDGGSGSLAVSAGSTCAWTATSDAAWLTVTNPGGTGSGAVAFDVAKTTSTTARIATIAIGGQTLTLTQAPQTAPPCDFTLSATAQSIAAAGLASTITVTSSGGCGWTAVSNDAWLTVTSGATGSGTGTVGLTAAANTSTSPRVGTVTIAGQTLTVTQAATPCSYLLSATAQALPAAAGTGTVTVSAAAGCAWTATSNAAWLTVTAGASGSGTAAVSYSVAANTSSVARSATLTIAGQTVTINQAGVPCTYAISASTQSFTAPAAAGSVSVTAPAGCAWTAASSASWLTVTSGASGTGNGSVADSAAANPSSVARSATLTIAGQTVAINQAGVPCSYVISATSQAFATTGGTGTVTVTAPSGCAWTSSSNASWVTVTSGGSGNGTSTLTFSVAANTGSTARNTTVTIAGQTFTVSQAFTPCTFALSATGKSLSAAAGTDTVTVTAPAGCAWTSSSNATWLTVTSGGSGNGTGTLTFAATANTGASARTGTLTIAGQVFTVTQTGVSCTVTISATTQSLPFAAGTGGVTVTAPAGCGWTTTTSASWLTVTAGGSGTGPGTVAFSVAANTATAARTAAFTIGGQTLTVTQAGTPSCTVTVSPGTKSYNSKKGSGTVAVTNSTSCAWTAVSSASWLTVTSAQIAQGSVAYSLIANGTGLVRTGTITIGTATFTVTQTNTSSPNVVTGLHIVAEGGL